MGEIFLCLISRKLPYSLGLQVDNISGFKSYWKNSQHYVSMFWKIIEIKSTKSHISWWWLTRLNKIAWVFYIVLMPIISIILRAAMCLHYVMWFIAQEEVTDLVLANYISSDCVSLWEEKIRNEIEKNKHWTTNC